MPEDTKAAIHIRAAQEIRQASQMWDRGEINSETLIEVVRHSLNLMENKYVQGMK